MNRTDTGGEQGRNDRVLDYATPLKGQDGKWRRRLMIAALILFSGFSWVVPLVGTLAAWVAIPILCNALFKERAVLWSIILNQACFFVPFFIFALYSELTGQLGHGSGLPGRDDWLFYGLVGVFCLLLTLYVLVLHAKLLRSHKKASAARSANHR